MARPFRARRILKWTGAGLSALILAIWLASFIWRDDLLDYIFICGQTVALVSPGVIAIGSSPDAVDSATIVVCLLAEYSRFGFGFVRPRMVYPAHAKSGFGGGIAIPFWFLLLLTAIPTAWLWHRDRRRIRPGCCLRCGYDLTGNTSGVCSECGERRPDGVGTYASGTVEANG